MGTGGLYGPELIGCAEPASFGAARHFPWNSWWEVTPVCPQGAPHMDPDLIDASPCQYAHESEFRVPPACGSASLLIEEKYNGQPVLLRRRTIGVIAAPHSERAAGRGPSAYRRDYARTPVRLPPQPSAVDLWSDLVPPQTSRALFNDRILARWVQSAGAARRSTGRCADCWPAHRAAAHRGWQRGTQRQATGVSRGERSTITPANYLGSVHLTEIIAWSL